MLVASSGFDVENVPPRFLREMIFFAALGLLLNSCVLEPKEDQSDEGRIIGTWIWEYTYGGFAGLYLTPESEGYTEKWCFTEQRVRDIWRNDSLLSTTSYRLDIFISPWDGKEVPVIYLGDQYCTGYRFITDDTLLLDDSMLDMDDGFSSRYYRE